MFLRRGTRCQTSETAMPGSLTRVSRSQDAMPVLRRSMPASRPSFHPGGERCQGRGKRCQVSRRVFPPSRRDVQIARQSMPGRWEYNRRCRNSNPRGRNVWIAGTRSKIARRAMPGEGNLARGRLQRARTMGYLLTKHLPAAPQRNEKDHDPRPIKVGQPPRQFRWPCPFRYLASTPGLEIPLLGFVSIERHCGR